MKRGLLGIDWHCLGRFAAVRTAETEDRRVPGPA